MEKSLTQIHTYYKSLLPELSADAWAYCASKFTVRQIKKGNWLVREGEICRNVSFINKGILCVYRVADGNKMVGGFFAENTYISEYTSFLTQSPATMFIEALEDTEVVDFRYEDMQEAYRQYKVLERFGRLIAEYLFTQLDARVYSLHALSAEERYLQLLRKTPSVFQRVPQYLIASYLGVTPEAISRIRKRIAS